MGRLTRPNHRNHDTACSLSEGPHCPSLSWRGGSDTTLTSNQLLPGLVFLTDLASHRSPRFPSEPRNQEVPG
jgi:hypothetical protein